MRTSAIGLGVRQSRDNPQSRPILPVLDIFGRQGRGTPAKIKPDPLAGFPACPTCQPRRISRRNDLARPAPVRENPRRRASASGEGERTRETASVLPSRTAWRSTLAVSRIENHRLCHEEGSHCVVPRGGCRFARDAGAGLVLPAAGANAAAPSSRIGGRSGRRRRSAAAANR